LDSFWCSYSNPSIIGGMMDDPRDTIVDIARKISQHSAVSR